MNDDWGDWAGPEQVAAAAAQPEQQPAASLHKSQRPALDESLFSSGAGDGESDEFGGFEAAAPAPPQPLQPAQQPQATCGQRSELAKGDPAWYLDGRSGTPQWVEAKVRRPPP